MGYLHVYSPHDGREVKVREQDIGRSVRDGEGRIFYFLKRADGSYYGSLTREGGPEQEANYDAMVAREGEVKQQAAATTYAAVHDATGKKRGGSGKAIVIVFVIVVVALLWAIKWGPLKEVAKNWQAPPGEKTDQNDGGKNDADKKDESQGAIDVPNRHLVLADSLSDVRPMPLLDLNGLTASSAS